MKHTKQQKMPSEEEFFALYGMADKPQLGLEGELFVTRKGVVAEGAYKVLTRVEDPVHYSQELGDTQLEMNTDPQGSVDKAIRDLINRREAVEVVAHELGLALVTMPVGPAGLPQTIAPFNERYKQMGLALKMKEALEDALRVTSFQPNLSFTNMEDLLTCYNRLVRAWKRLRELGDKSNGERWGLYNGIYKKMGVDPTPKIFETAGDMYRTACEMGWAADPKEYRPYIQIKPGTETTPALIEVRVIDAIEDPEVMREVLNVTLDIAGFAF